MAKESVVTSSVVYDSRYGNTERVARAIAAALGASGPTRIVEAGDPAAFDTGDVDLLVVGGPTEGHGVSPGLRERLDSLPGGAFRSVAAASFDTRLRLPLFLSGSAAREISEVLAARGARLVAPPESFFVGPRYGPLLDGEVERAAAWATGVAAELAAALRPVG
jgi:flavorubredoxin